MSTSTLPTFQNLLIERREAVTILFVNRPTVMNAINRETLAEIHEATRQFIADPTQGALIITGSGAKAFISGADINELAPLGPAAAEDISRFGQGVVDQLERSPKPVIAAVNGYAFGGGCELALACHMRLASDNMVMGLPEVKLGIIPGYGGTQRLPRLVGPGRALELILSARNVKADEAERIGLVNRTLPHDELLPFVHAYVKELADNVSPTSMAIMKRQIYTRLEAELGVSLDESIWLMTESFRRPDFPEGVNSYLEKRPPKFARIKL